MKNLRGVVLGVLFVLLFGSLPLQAQQSSAVSGVVSDKSGGMVSGTKVALDNTQLGLHETTTTNDLGFYQFLRLAPGEGYALTFTKDGFTKLVLSNITLSVTTTETRNVTLELGVVTQSIQVEAAGEATLNTTDASVGDVIDARAVSELPIQFRMNPATLMELQAGVNDAGSITGSRSDQGNITLDGLDLNDQATGQAFFGTVSVSIDALQEVRTVTAGETADYGRSSGGGINLVTKSGTNNWHGNLREYNRNTLFEANDWFNNRSGVPRAPLVRNQFGGNLGGPIKKDKVFFFFDYEGLREAASSENVRAVPTPQYRSGELGYINSNAGCTASARFATQPSCITYLTPTQVAALDPQGVGDNTSLLSFINSRYPSKINDPGAAGDGINTDGFLFTAPAHTTQNDYTGRIDWNISAKHKLYLRGIVDRQGVDDDFNTAIVEFPGDPTPDLRDAFDNYVFSMGWTWTVSNNLINEFSGGLTRQIASFPTRPAPTYPNSFGFNANISGPYLGSSSQSRNVPVPEIRDSFTWIKGKHTMDFGTDIKLIRQITALKNDFNFIGIGLGGLINSLNSSLRPSDINSDPSAITDWDNFFPFELGRYSSVFSNFNYNKSGVAYPNGTGKNRDFNYNEFEFYGLDTWKVRSDLSIAYGLHYQVHTVPYEINGFQSVPSVNESTYLGDRLTAAAQGVSGFGAVPLVSYNLGGAANNAPGYYKPDHKDFGPRLGISYNPGFRSGLLGSLLGDRKTTIRAGSAILYERIAGGASFGLDQNTFLFDSQANNPFGVANNANASLMNDPRFNGLSSNLPPFPAAPSTKPPVTPNVVGGIPIGTAVLGGFPAFFQFDRNTRSPYSIKSNFGIQRELPGNLLLEVTYVNTLGRRLLAVGDSATITNFKDTTSGQFLRQAFGQLQQELPNINPATGAVPAIPWFENQINSLLAAAVGPGANCSNVFSFSFANCASLVADVWPQFITIGDLSSTVLVLTESGLLFPNIGLPAQTSANGYIGNYASSNYNAMLFSLRKQASRGLQFAFNYTYSHSIDNMSNITNSYVTYTGTGAGLVCELDDLRICRASSDFDARHVINANYIYDLPLGHGKRWLSGAPGWVDAIVGGWSTSGLVFWRTGYPFTIHTNAFPTAFTLDAPAVLLSAAGLKPGIHTDSAGNLQYFASQSTAIAAMGYPFAGAVGTRNAARGPNFSAVDMGIWKAFKVPKSERQRFILRMDTFNTFNHPVFNGPASATLANTSQFGIITSTASVPRVLQVALRYEF
ncbi:MAG TPA: carboxypeptidase regulatory-like domain-containing protein [Candidatus Acidoferrum sp.]|nr:carboxypeptidase regulatory-like domain-containing protein [Candidatus Acidoferrum sp.]